MSGGVSWSRSGTVLRALRFLPCARSPFHRERRRTFFVENKAGAAGTIGIASVVLSAPDGYTLVANATTYALLPHIFRAYAESIGAEPGLWDAAAFARNLRERTAFWGKVAANTAFEKQ